VVQDVWIGLDIGSVESHVGETGGEVVIRRPTGLDHSGWCSIRGPLVTLNPLDPKVSLYSYGSLNPGPLVSLNPLVSLGSLHPYRTLDSVALETLGPLVPYVALGALDAGVPDVSLVTLSASVSNEALDPLPALGALWALRTLFTVPLPALGPLRTLDALVGLETLPALSPLLSGTLPTLPALSTLESLKALGSPVSLETLSPLQADVALRTLDTGVGPLVSLHPHGSLGSGRSVPKLAQGNLTARVQRGHPIRGSLFGIRDDRKGVVRQDQHLGSQAESLDEKADSLEPIEEEILLAFGTRGMGAEFLEDQDDSAVPMKSDWIHRLMMESLQSSFKGFRRSLSVIV